MAVPARSLTIWGAAALTAGLILMGLAAVLAARYTHERIVPTCAASGCGLVYLLTLVVFGLGVVFAAGHAHDTRACAAALTSGYDSVVAIRLASASGA